MDIVFQPCQPAGKWLCNNWYFNLGRNLIDIVSHTGCENIYLTCSDPMESPVRTPSRPFTRNQHHPCIGVPLEGALQPPLLVSD